MLFLDLTLNLETLSSRPHVEPIASQKAESQTIAGELNEHDGYVDGVVKVFLVGVVGCVVKL